MAVPTLLVERLTIKAVREMVKDGGPGVSDDLVSVVYSPLYQAISDAIRAALIEAARVVREETYLEVCKLDACAHEGPPEWLAAAIESLLYRFAVKA